MVNSRGESLETLRVKFVYSKSGEGQNLSISSTPDYGPQKRVSFAVQYEWVEEEEVNPRAAMAVMMMIVFISSVFMLLSSCTSTSMEDGEDDAEPSHPSQQQSSYGYDAQPVNSGVPKWD